MEPSPLTRGFSLIEMMVVLVIIALITTIALFGQQDFNRSLLLTDTAYTIALTAREALGMAGETLELPEGIATVGGLRDWLVAAGRERLATAKNLTREALALAGAEQAQRQAGRLHGQHQRRHAEERALQRVALALVDEALRQRARRRQAQPVDLHRSIGNGQLRFLAATPFDVALQRGHAFGGDHVKGCLLPVCGRQSRTRFHVLRVGRHSSSVPEQARELKLDRSRLCQLI